MEAGLRDAPLALRDSAKAIPIISDNGLPLLTENSFQILPFYLNHPLPLPRLLIFKLSVGPSPLLLRPPSPIIWNWRVFSACKQVGINH